MSRESSPFSPVFSIDVAAQSPAAPQAVDLSLATVQLLRQIAQGQERQNKLLEQLVINTSAMQRQRNAELQQWREANPELSKSCRRAADSLARVQTAFLDQITEEIQDSEENMLEGDYMLNEFVDRFGPRLAHLNGVLQVMAQLGTGQPAPMQSQ
jgi:hypothetical protein